VGVFNDDILEFYNTSVDIELIELRALKSPRFPPFYSPFQPLNSGITNTTQQPKLRLHRPTENASLLCNKLLRHTEFRAARIANEPDPIHVGSSTLCTVFFELARLLVIFKAESYIHAVTSIKSSQLYCTK
jgi:hypothetical protein